MTIRTFTAAVALGLAALAPAVAHADITLLGSFNPSDLGQLNAIGFDSATDLIYVHESFNTNIHVYNRSGVFQGTIDYPLESSNDSDIEFSGSSINLGGVVVAPNTLILLENELDPVRIVPVDKATGDLLTVGLSINGGVLGQLVGGAYHPGRGTLFILDWSADQVLEFNPATGTLLNSFPVAPLGSTAFDIFFGDLDVNVGDGNLYLVTSSSTNEGNEKIRILSPTGDWLGDIDLEALGIDANNFSGIAFDDLRGEAWLSSTDGEVFHLGGFAVIPEPAALILLALGAIALFRRR